MAVPLKGAPITWIKEMEEAFKASKQALEAATMLAHPREKAEPAIMLDAFAEHVSAALQQRARPTAGRLGATGSLLQEAVPSADPLPTPPLSASFHVFFKYGIHLFRFMLEVRGVHPVHGPQVADLENGQSGRIVDSASVLPP